MLKAENISSHLRALFVNTEVVNFIGGLGSYVIIDWIIPQVLSGS